MKSLLSRGTVRAAGGAAMVAPPTVAHVLALEAFKSPFVVGGKVEAKDVAICAWVLSTPGERLETLGSLAKLPRGLARIMAFYAENAAEVEADSEKIAALLKETLCFYRSAKDGENKKTEAMLGLAIMARLMALFGYSRREAMAERADWAVALIETMFALDGRMRIISDAQAELMDKLDEAEREAENGGEG